MTQDFPPSCSWVGFASNGTEASRAENKPQQGKKNTFSSAVCFWISSLWYDSHKIKHKHVGVVYTCLVWDNACPHLAKLTSSFFTFRFNLYGDTTELKTTSLKWKQYCLKRSQLQMDPRGFQSSFRLGALTMAACLVLIKTRNLKRADEEGRRRSSSPAAELNIETEDLTLKIWDHFVVLLLRDTAPDWHCPSHAAN